jgi:2-keto-4-pentenoate hydratase/2-oxohepta-3-ene-1,7-dioic acid hydratase in catechol pathway
MRLCRFQDRDRVEVGFYEDTRVVRVSKAANLFRDATGEQIDLPSGDDLLSFLPPSNVGPHVEKLADWVADNMGSFDDDVAPGLDDIELLVPVPRPNKLLLLAGNYAAHVEEGGEIAVERAETFPYFFMKPPSTTLRPSGGMVELPAVSPATIDYELELAVIIGRTAKGVPEANALDYVAGYTIINDISDRKFRPHPHRRGRERDKFFDWLHGKWHDGCCPCGPCVASSKAIPDPQRLSMQLRVNDQIRQDATTALQVFPVAAVIEFISSFVTLEPGDIISTGTPSGVGGPQGLFLRSGDRIEGSIESIGTLVTTMS